jgi:hypothetical protein
MLFVLCALCKYSIDPAGIWRDQNSSLKRCKLSSKMELNVKMKSKMVWNFTRLVFTTLMDDYLKVGIYRLSL